MTKFETILRLAEIKGVMGTFCDPEASQAYAMMGSLIHDLSKDELDDDRTDEDEELDIIGCCNCSPCATQGHFTVTVGRDNKEIICLRCGVKCE